MKKNISLLLLLTFITQSCSLKNNDSAIVTKTDDYEFVVDEFVEQSAQEFVAKAETNHEEFASVSAADLGNMPALEKFDIKTEVESIQEAPEKAIVAKLDEQFGNPLELKNEENYSGLEQEYVVQKGDTLMMIAFKIYGDYSKWKEIAKVNPGLKSISEGMKIRYVVPDTEFGWKPSGMPYLVKRGDNLGTISYQIYNTSKKWRQLYEFNKPLIKDPDLIFAGFTIYYQPARDLASKEE